MERNVSVSFLLTTTLCYLLLFSFLFYSGSIEYGGCIFNFKDTLSIQKSTSGVRKLNIVDEQ